MKAVLYFLFVLEKLGSKRLFHMVTWEKRDNGEVVMEHRNQLPSFALRVAKRGEAMMQTHPNGEIVRLRWADIWV